MVLRKQLTEVQFKHLLQAQLRVQNAETEYKAAQAHLEQISSLVLDAHQVQQHDRIELDVNTRELVVKYTDADITASNK